MNSEPSAYLGSVTYVTPAVLDRKGLEVSRSTGKGLARAIARGFVCVALVTAFGAVPATSASATDWGGDGNPNVSCPGGYTVKAANIYGTRGVTKGKIIGQVQLRWSSTCRGQWSRVVLYGGLYTNYVTIEQIVQSEGRTAGANDRVLHGTAGNSTWTPYLRLADSRSRACAQAWVSSDFGTLNFHTNGAQVCSPS